MEFFVGIILQFVLGFVSLIITGRIFDKISSEHQATWAEDAQAAGLIVTLTTIVSMVPIVSSFSIFVYLGLIYFAFQLDGFMDIVSFYIIHALINAGVMSILLLISVKLPIMETIR